MSSRIATCPPVVANLVSHLVYGQRRVLSALPERQVATAAGIARATCMDAAEIAAIANSLVEAELIETIELDGNSRFYRLTARGSAHPQRSAWARRATLLPRPHPSRRTYQILAYLNECGATRTVDLARGLRIERGLLNGTMQNLKKRNLVQTQPAGQRGAPYVIAQDGCKKLMTLCRELPAEDNPTQSTPTAVAYSTPRPFRSDRIFQVMAHLDQNGPTRTVDLARHLRLQCDSLNAQMQILKHRKIIQNHPADQARAPYVLTPEGRQKLRFMRQARRAPEINMG